MSKIRISKSQKEEYEMLMKKEHKERLDKATQERSHKLALLGAEIDEFKSNYISNPYETLRDFWLKGLVTKETFPIYSYSTEIYINYGEIVPRLLELERVFKNEILSTENMSAEEIADTISKKIKDLNAKR